MRAAADQMLGGLRADQEAATCDDTAGSTRT
jgi:hypothetical protein